MASNETFGMGHRFQEDRTLSFCDGTSASHRILQPAHAETPLITAAWGICSRRVKQDERRAHPRHGVEVNVQFRKDGTQARTHDLSLGGCAIIAPRLRLVNEKLAIALEHPKTREELEVVGEVKRAMGLPDGKFLLGVQFVEVDDALRAKLTAFLESSVPKVAPTEEAARLVAEATREEHAGNVRQAISLLEKAIAAAPKRADILATLARLASQSGDMTGAANWAKRAADVDPENETYAQLHKRFSGGRAGSSGSSKATPEARHAPASKQPFLPPERRGVILLGAGAAVLFLVLWWVWSR